MDKLKNKFYLVGIKGTGMSALALMLKDEGNEVLGSDTNEYFFTEKSLINNDIKILEFNKENIIGDSYYIIGNAYNDNNEEVLEIINNNYKYSYYYEFIGKINNKKIIACSGTHGKTTTTKLIVELMNKRCSYIVGDGSGKGYKENNLFVLEACEYKRHFLSYNPDLLIINNIELDHTDYYKNIKDMISAYQELANKSKMILINADDKNSKKIKHNNKITFGFNKNSDARIKILSKGKDAYYIALNYNEEIYLKIPFLGKHMIYNYVCAYLACLINDIIPLIKEEYELPRRRMETKLYNKSVLISDYAHHPTEIKALYDYVNNKYEDRKINVIFQPHTYERTIRLKKEFVKSLKLFDNVFVQEVYTSKRESKSINKQKIVDKIFSDFKKYNDDVFKTIGLNNDVWIFLGAGNASYIMEKLINEN